MTINRWKLSRATRADATKPRRQPLFEPLNDRHGGTYMAGGPIGGCGSCGYHKHAPTCPTQRKQAAPAQAEAPKPAAPPASEPGMPEGWVEHPTSASREVGYRIYRRADWCVFNMRYVGKSWRWYASHGGDLKHETATAREAAEYADAQLAKLDADRVARMGADAAAQYTRGLAALDAQKAPSEAAMPTRFKVGDRVRIEDSEQFHPEARNQLATVVCAPKPGSNGYEVTPDCWHDGTVQYAFEYQLELAPAEQPAPPRPRPTWRRACREADAMLRGGR
jgi:hypothetical protein